MYNQKETELYTLSPRPHEKNFTRYYQMIRRRRSLSEQALCFTKNPPATEEMDPKKNRTCCSIM
jgi:hypothetical protein